MTDELRACRPTTLNLSPIPAMGNVVGDGISVLFYAYVFEFLHALRYRVVHLVVNLG